MRSFQNDKNDSFWYSSDEMDVMGRGSLLRSGKASFPYNALSGERREDPLCRSGGPVPHNRDAMWGMICLA